MADEELNDSKEELSELALFDPTKKKKKPIVQEAADDSLEKLVEKAESSSVSDGVDNSFMGLKKKKKKQPVEASLLEEETRDRPQHLDDRVGEDEDVEGNLPTRRLFPWEEYDRDYKYQEVGYNFLYFGLLIFVLLP